MLGSRRISKNVCRNTQFFSRVASFPKARLSTITNRDLLLDSSSNTRLVNLMNGNHSSFLNTRKFSTMQLTPLENESVDGPLFQTDRNVRNIAIIGESQYFVVDA